MPRDGRERPGRTGPCRLVGGTPQLKPKGLWLINRWREMYRTRQGVNLPGCYPKSSPPGRMSVNPLWGVF